MPENNIVIKLYDYLCGDCKFKGCSKNKLGLCTSNDIDHMDYIAKIVKHSLNTNTGVLTNQNMICKEFDVKEGCCEFCGSVLKEIHESHNYGDGNATEVLYECLNPKCK